MKNVLGVKNSDPKEQLSEPIANNLLVKTLTFALEFLDVGGKVTL